MITIGDKISPEQAMEEALRVAEKGRGFVSPNPLVGCVIVDKNHCFLSRGAHEKFGELHAERNAINNVADKEKLEGGTLYVTLEPCCHTGKTSPCTEAILETSLASVVYGMEDPNPQVAGQGVKTLLDAHLKVGLFTTFQEKCEDLVDEFLHLQQSDLPYICLKVATSMDGQIALKNGASQWITGPESRAYGRTLRAHSSATMVGAGTLINDDPLLDFRDTNFEGKKKNKIIILDPKGKAVDFFSQSRLKNHHAAEDIFVIAPEEAAPGWQGQGVQWLPWLGDEAGWHESMLELRRRGVYNIFVEGGSYAMGQFLKYKMFNQVFLFMAPKIIGRGLSWSKGLKTMDMASVFQAAQWTHQSLGDDLLITAKFSQ